MRYVIKRTGEKVEFDPMKIRSAVAKAGRATKEFDEAESDRLTRIIVAQIPDDIATVEQIQDLVEQTLMESRHHKTAKAYILYREQHRKLRDLKSLLDPRETIQKYLEKLDWRVNENSNTSYSLQGLNMHLATSVVSRYWLNEVYPPEVRNAHVSGELYIHDLGYLAAYCVGWDLKDLLLRGLGGVYGKVESKPAKHFRSALGQMVNFIFTMQGEAAGAQAFSSVDTYLAPFIRNDHLRYDEVKQAVQEFVFNMNVPTRSGFQSPFSNITLDLKPHGATAGEQAVIGGEPIQETYADFQLEMDMFNRAFAEVMLAGDAKGRVFSFPIPTYNITKDFDWNNPVYDPIFEMTAKFGIPYWSNFVNSDMSPDDTRSMCCRLRLDTRELQKRGGGLFAANPLTGSIGVVTIDLPRIGYLSHSKGELLDRLSHVMDVARTSLEIKRKIIENLTAAGLYPYSRHYLDAVKERNGTYWANHFNTIGINGMNELLLNFAGVTVAETEGQQLALEIMDFMLGRLEQFQHESGQLYNLEASPAESATYVLAKQDKALYPDIIVANEGAFRDGADPYYTNSTQLPVAYTTDPFEALDLQDPIQTKYTGGTVLHLFLGERLESADQAKQLVRAVTSSYRLPYFTLTPTFSICPKHGYIAGNHPFCPVCDDELIAEAQKSAARPVSEDIPFAAHPER
ncbi:ribonucleoside triphosphate reductase [bacterium]|nr:ribonucleoside triphosphate reductase [bacterium]